MRTFTTAAALAVLLGCGACTPAYYAACPGGDLHRCEGLSKETSLQSNAAIKGVIDADGIKDHDHGLPIGNGATLESKKSDPDEAGDNGCSCPGSKEH